MKSILSSTSYNRGNIFKKIDPLTFKEKKEIWPEYDGWDVPQSLFEDPAKTREFTKFIEQRLKYLISHIEDCISNLEINNVDRELNLKNRTRVDYCSFSADFGFYTSLKRTLEDDLTKLYKHLSGSYLDKSVTFKDFTSIFMDHDVDPENKLPWIGFKGDLKYFIYYMPDHLAGQKRKSSKNKIASKVFCLKNDKGEIEDFDNIQLGKFDPTENELAIKDWYENL